MVRFAKKLAPQAAGLRRVLGFALLLVFVSGFDGCFEEQQVMGFRTQVGQLYLPRIETLEVVGLEGPGAQELEHALVHELLRSTSYAVFDGHEGLPTPANALQKDPFEYDASAHAAMLFGTVTQNQVADAYTTQRIAEHSTQYTREGAFHLAVALRFVDKQTKEVLDSTVLTFDEELPTDTRTQPGEPLSADDGIDSLFASRDLHTLSDRGYRAIAKKLSHELQGRTPQTKVPLFVSNRINAYDPLSAASERAHKGDWRSAASLYRSALSQYENNGMTHRGVGARLTANLATCYAMSGRLPEAMTLYDKSLAYEYVKSIQEAKERCAAWLAQADDAEPVVREQ